MWFVAQRCASSLAPWCRFPWQVFYYAAHASNPCVKTICEIGFGAGHSTLLYLSVNKDAVLYTFDIFELGPFQDAAVEFHKSVPHARRWHRIKGDSQQTVPKFASENPGVKCDIVHVDGWHESPVVYNDIKNFRLLAHQETVVLIDDANEAPTQGDMQQAVDKGVTEEWECMDARDETDERFASQPIWPKRFCTTRYILA